MAAVKLTLQVILLLILTRGLVLSNMVPYTCVAFTCTLLRKIKMNAGTEGSLHAAMDHGTNLCMPVSEKMLSRWRVEAVARGGSGVIT